jgi:hypothetical protein
VNEMITKLITPPVRSLSLSPFPRLPQLTATRARPEPFHV